MKYLIQLVLCFFISIHTNYSQGFNVEASFEKLKSQYKNVGITAAYSYGKEIQWLSSTGYADRKNQIEFTDSTLTRIASITKPMTAVCIMQLVEKGLIQLDDPISMYIPDYPKKKKKEITLRHLLSHTSGIKGYKNFKEATSTIQYDELSDAAELFKNRKLKFEPGTNFQYTSYGYVLLGMVIEKATGLGFERYLQENILDPLAMKDTGIEKYDSIYVNKSKLYHMEKDKAIEPLPNNLSNRIPAGSLYSTAEDLIKFGNGLIDNQLITEASLNEMLKIGFPVKKGNPYGLGLALYGPKDQENLFFGHEGGQYGGNTMFIVFPKAKATIVVLSNTSETADDNISLFAVELLEETIRRYKAEKN